MISEGSCDTEYWSNDANIQLCYYRKKFILNILKYKIVIITFYNATVLLYIFLSLFVCNLIYIVINHNFPYYTSVQTKDEGLYLLYQPNTLINKNKL